MKIEFLIVILFLIHAGNIFGQSDDYFLGKRTYCDMPADKESRERYKLGLDCIQQNLYIGAANQIFQDLIKQDSTFCDAYFFAGYTFRMSNMNKEAVIMYYMADSLAQNRSIEFKMNLAAAGMAAGAIDLSRKKYEEMTKFFPHSAEGYYGIAVTSTMIGDIEYGLKNINIAEDRHQEDYKDTQFMKAVLLTMNGKYEESLSYFEKTKSRFSKLDHFNGNYALSLYEVGTAKKDEKMLKKARKHYDKVEDKDALTEHLRSKFK